MQAATSYTNTALDYPGATETYAYGIDGSNLVGLYLDSNYLPHGFKYDGTNWTSLGYPNASETKAYGIDGRTIVGYYYDSNDTVHVSKPRSFSYLKLRGWP